MTNEGKQTFTPVSTGTPKNMKTSSFIPTLSPESLAFYEKMAKDLTPDELAACLQGPSTTIANILRNYDFSDFDDDEHSQIAIYRESVRIMIMASEEYQSDIIRKEVPLASPETLMDAPAFNPPTSIPVLLTLEQVISMLLEVRDAGEQDPGDYADGWIDGLKKAIESIHGKATGLAYDWNPGAVVPPAYIVESLAALRFCRSVIMDIHGNCDITDLISESIDDELEAPELYYALQEVVAFLDDDGCYDLSEQMAHEKASNAMLGFPEIPCGFDDDLDGSEKNLSLLAEPLPTLEEIKAGIDRAKAIPDAHDLYPYNRI